MSVELLSPLMSPAKVAWILNVSERMIYKLTAQNQLGFVRVGGSLRVSPSALLDYLLCHSVRPRRLPGAGLERLCSEDWERIERLIASQVEARREAA